MKNTVIDLLIYIFERYVDDEMELNADQDRLRVELKEAGFDPAVVSRAFDWLEGLAHNRDSEHHAVTALPTSMRIYAREEQNKLDTECRGFLYFLEQVGALDAQNRELVIDRVMALEADDIDIGQLKWIVLMVLFNQPGQEHASVWMEDLVLDDSCSFIH